jgi:hypothetical protein
MACSNVDPIGTGVTTATGLVGIPLTGNRDMAEDLEREPCATCGRTFAPSVLSRHAAVCKKRADNAVAAAGERATLLSAPQEKGQRARSPSEVFGDGIDRPLYKVVLTGGPCAGKTTR